jgi:hypothetical protein
VIAHPRLNRPYFSNTIFKKSITDVYLSFDGGSLEEVVGLV